MIRERKVLRQIHFFGGGSKYKRHFCSLVEYNYLIAKRITIYYGFIRIVELKSIITIALKDRIEVHFCKAIMLKI